MEKPVLVGVYELGVYNIRLYATSEEGPAASFLFNPSDGGCPKLTVSCGGRRWSEVLSGLLHEAMESQLHQRGAGYLKTHSARETTCDYVFVMTHATFDQCVDFSMRLLAACETDLFKAWKKQNKRK